MCLVHMRDGYSKIVVISCLIAIAHGFTHLKFPFLDEALGVVHDVDVWQDQCVHGSQALLFGYVWYDKMNKWGKLALLVFILGNITNVVVGYNCWNSWCYDLFLGQFVSSCRWRSPFCGWSDVQMSSWGWEVAVLFPRHSDHYVFLLLQEQRRGAQILCSHPIF